MIGVVIVLATISAALAVAAILGAPEDAFLTGMGALLLGCSAVGVLVGKVIGGSGDAPCPACGSRIHDVDSTAHVVGILCTNCGRFLESKGGRLRPIDPDMVTDQPLFGASLGDGFEWPAGCVVCGVEATEARAAGVTETDAATQLGLNAVGIALVATVGVGWVTTGKKRVLYVPHCSEHHDGAILANGGPTGLMLLFRSHAYQQAFCERNGAASVESRELGRSGGPHVFDQGRPTRARAPAVEKEDAARPGDRDLARSARKARAAREAARKR